MNEEMVLNGVFSIRKCVCAQMAMRPARSAKTVHTFHQGRLLVEQSRVPYALTIHFGFKDVGGRLNGSNTLKRLFVCEVFLDVMSSSSSSRLFKPKVSPSSTLLLGYRSVYPSNRMGSAGSKETDSMLGEPLVAIPRDSRKEAGSQRA